MSEEKEPLHEGRLAPLVDRQLSIEYLKSRGYSLDIHTFTVAKNVDFFIHQRSWPEQAWHLTSSSGAMVDLGGGSWLYAATAYGTRKGSPVSIAWSFEYKADEDRLEVQTVNGTPNYFYGVLNTASPIQIRKDISGMPTLILVRERVFVENCSGEYCRCAASGSFIVFGN